MKASICSICQPVWFLWGVRKERDNREQRICYACFTVSMIARQYAPIALVSCFHTDNTISLPSFPFCSHPFPLTLVQLQKRQQLHLVSSLPLLVSVSPRQLYEPALLVADPLVPIVLALSGQLPYPFQLSHIAPTLLFAGPWRNLLGQQLQCLRSATSPAWTQAPYLEIPIAPLFFGLFQGTIRVH